MINKNEIDIYDEESGMYTIFSFKEFIEALMKRESAGIGKRKSILAPVYYNASVRNKTKELDVVYRSYYNQIMEIEGMPLDEQLPELAQLFQEISSQYDLSNYSEEVYDFAEELKSSEWKEESKEDPPFTSIAFGDSMSNLKIAQAKMLYLYWVIRNRLLLRLRRTLEKMKDRSNSLDEKKTIIKRFKNNKERRDYVGGLNNRLRNYIKMAKIFLKIKSSREKMDSLKGLTRLIEDECKTFISKDSLLEWDYIEKDSETGVSREIMGPPDFDVFTSAFNNKAKRREFATLLDCPPFKEQELTFAELEIFALHTAVKVEFERAEMELKCQTHSDCINDKSLMNVHFSKQVTDEELTAIYNGLMDHEMLCDNPTLADFIYWHTGSGTRPEKTLIWKQKNVCHYYVQIYLNSKWTIAEQCFSCKKGSISRLDSASNITKKNREIINEILKEARQRSTKKTTKTD